MSSHVKRVLVAVHSRVIRQAIEMTLAHLDLELRAAPSSADALALAESSEFAVALVDHWLPDGSGYELAARLHVRSPSLKIVLLTSRDAPYDAVLGERAGIAASIVKPFDTERLIAVVMGLRLESENRPPPPQPGGVVPQGAPSPSRHVFGETLSGLPDQQQAASVPLPSAIPARGATLSYGAPASVGAAPSARISQVLAEATPPPSTFGSGGPPKNRVPPLEPLPSLDPGDARPPPGGGGGDSGAVNCSVFCPPAPLRGDRFLIQVFAHSPSQAEAAKLEATVVDAGATARGHKRLILPIQVGMTLQVELVAPELVVENSVEALVWTGKPEAVQFEVMVPWHQRTGDVLFAIVVRVNGIPLGSIRSKLSVRAGGEGDRRRLVPKPSGETARRFETAFASYATPDRPEVVKRVQVLRAAGVECFLDVADLSPGERWAQELYRNIDVCDLFLLFWSGAAKSSEWVLKEALYALERQTRHDKALPEIHPVLLEGPPVPTPPPQLAHLHFNDALLALMAQG